MTATASNPAAGPATLTVEQLHALMAMVPRVPHHLALASDVMFAVALLATKGDAGALSVVRCTAMPIREDPTLPPGAWERRNRDGSRFDEEG